MLHRRLAPAWSLITVLLVAVSALSGCDPLGKPSLSPAFGARVTEGELQIWTGSACSAVTEFSLTFDPYRDGRAELALQAVDASGSDLERFTVGGPTPGFHVSKALPPGFDWHKAESVRLSVERTGVSWGPSTNLSEVLANSASHPDDTYWFQDVGWLSPGEVKAKDGKTFLAICTPDPKK